MKLKYYIISQIQEIKSYKSLRWYGFFLSFSHIVTFFFWHRNSVIHQYLTKNANTVCWPQLPFCESLRFLSSEGAEILLYIYLSAAFLSSFLFLNKKTTTSAYFLFLLINLIKLYIYFMDYRLSGNYHYMPFLVSFAFLFVRQKLFFIPLLISLFYLFAGILKISNLDWFTGLVFPKEVQMPLFFNEPIKMLLCFYVVCLEIIGTWFLILKTRWKAAFYIQFLLFHIMSYFIVGYFYPLIMMCLLSLFLLIFFFKETYRMEIKKSLSGILFITLVILGNILSVFIPGDAGFTGEGRLYGLNMYDAHTECTSQIVIKFKNKTIKESFDSYREYALRIQCDPYIDFNTVHKICTYYKNESDFIDIDWTLYSKLRSDVEYKKIVNEKDICQKKIKYSSWRKNQWIKVFNQEDL